MDKKRKNLEQQLMDLSNKLAESDKAKKEGMEKIVKLTSSLEQNALLIDSLESNYNQVRICDNGLIDWFVSPTDLSTNPNSPGGE